MENFAALLLPVLPAMLLLRFLMLPIKLIWKLLCNGLCGLLCLWLVNTVAGITGVYLPINLFTVFLAGTLGLPGIGLLALLELRL